MDDNEEVRELFDGCYRRLVAQLYGVCGDLAEAEDAVQEAFVRALAKPATLRRTDNPEAWLRRVAVNVLRSRWRRTRRHLWLSSVPEPPSDAPGLTPDHVALVEALRALPAAQREAIALHHIGDLPVLEVADATGVPVGTVKARLARGRAALSRLLDDSDPSEESHHAN